MALDLVSALEDGPAGTVAEALELIEQNTVDAAFLDGNLHGLPVDKAAASLTRKGAFSPKQLLEQTARLAPHVDNVVRRRKIREE